MSLIYNAIPEQNFEKILNRIGEILKEELDTQFLLTYDTDLEDIPVYKERAIPFSHVELPAVNVLLHGGEFSEQSQPNTQGTYRYLIECTYAAPGEDGDDVETGRGDTISKIKLNRLMGLIRAILEDPKYKTLGFAAPSIGRRFIERMYFMKTIHQDAEHVWIGRLEFVVKAPEYPAALSIPVPLVGADTVVKLEETEMGYQWVFTNP